MYFYPKIINNFLRTELKTKVDIRQVFVTILLFYFSYNVSINIDFDSWFRIIFFGILLFISYLLAYFYLAYSRKIRKKIIHRVIKLINIK